MIKRLNILSAIGMAVYALWVAFSHIYNLCSGIWLFSAHPIREQYVNDTITNCTIFVVDWLIVIFIVKLLKYQKS